MELPVVTEERITRFIRNHHIFTLATLNRGLPWTATCFYAYLPGRNLFVFTSDPVTIHGGNMLENSEVAGNIALETKVIGKIRGIQFSGRAFLLEGKNLSEGKRAYFLRFPYAAAFETTFWGLEPYLIKMTDNRLGFGKKLIWRKNAEPPVAIRQDELFQ